MTQTKRNLLIVLLVLIFIIWESISDMFMSYPIHNYPPRSAKILAFGDSLTVGVGASSESSGYISILKNRLSASIINKAVIGEMSSGTLLHAEKDLDETDPGIVLIFIGGNDFLLGTPPIETFSNIKKIITIAQQHHAVVYLIGFQQSQNDVYATGFKKIAKETGSLYTADILGGIITTPTLMSDEVHPNDKGYLKMADKIAPFMESLILSSVSESHSPNN